MSAGHHYALVPVQLGQSKPDGPPSPTKALINELARLTEKQLAERPPAKKKKGGSLIGGPTQEDSSSSDDEEYPPDPQQCTVTGPGFAGGFSGAPVKLFVHVKDERGKRLKEGGEDVAVRVQLTGPAPEYLPVEITDNNDGTYTAIYTPPTKGNYLVTVEVSGMSIAGSPFPVFFSAPLDPAALAALQEQEAAAAAAAAAGASAPAPPPGAAPAYGMDAGAAQGFGAAAVAGMSAVGGITDEHLRTLYVSNISPNIPIERLRELFTIFGHILDLQLLGDKKDMAVFVFAAKEAQVQGQQLNGTMFGDRPLNVTAPITAMAAGVVPANPQLAMQMQQMQQMQQAMLQSRKLAQQVAQMRAIQKSGAGHIDPQRFADEAAARLNKKFGSVGSGLGAALAAATQSAAAAASKQGGLAAGAAPAAAADGGDKDKGGRERESGRSRRGSRSRSRSRSPRRRRSRSRSRDRREREWQRERERRERERREFEMRERERVRRERERMDREREMERQRARERERTRREREEGRRRRSGSPGGRDRDREGGYW